MSTIAKRPQQQQFGDGVLVIAVLVLLSMGIVVWAAGEISGLLNSGRLPAASFPDMGRVILKLVSQPGDPAAAWPARSGAVMPGPFLFYGVLVVLLALAVALGAVAIKMWGSLTREPKARAAARWADLRDLRALIVKAPTPSRLTLGRVNSTLIAAEERQSIIVLGPTQSMKTTGFAIPAINEWKGPVLATSVKSDLVRDTLELRRDRGDVWVYDPTGSTEHATARWSPLELCLDWSGAQRTATWLTNATRSDRSGLSDAEFWYAASAKLIGPHLLAAAVTGRSMADVVRWINTQEEREVREALIEAGIPEALDAASATWKRDIRQKSSVYMTAETVLSAYEDPVVARSAMDLNFSADALLGGGSDTLYVVAPAHEQKRLRPLFETLLQTVINHAFELSSRNGGPLDPPLLIVLDEAANIAPLRDLDTLASTAASHGIQLVSIFQDLSQVYSRYGDGTQTVVNNHRGKIILSGISDTRTLEYASQLLGDEEVLHSSLTRGSGGARSTTESTSMRSMAPASVLRSIRPGEGVLVYGHLPPARLTLRPWFKEKRHRQQW
jgi:type IV secretion system protein VirD4